MQDSVAANHFGVGIGKKEERVSPVAAQLAGFRRRIDADRDDSHAARPELPKMFLETPQLGVTKRSPIAAVEDEQDTAAITAQIGQAHGPAV